MELSIRKTEFLKGLRLANSIADRKSTMPMLANALLRATSDKGLLVCATDLNVSVAADLEAKVKVPGAITLAAKSLFDVVANMPGDTVTLAAADNNWIEMRAGKVTCRLAGMPDRDFPRIPDHREATFCTVDTAVLGEMIDKTLFSVCTDETRFHLNGVLFESDGTAATMVSTDGHRLSRIQRPLKGGPVLSTGVIIPRKGIAEMKRILDAAPGPCELSIKTPYAFICAGGVTLAVKLIDSEFPPYDQVIPASHTKHATVPREPLLDSLKRAQLVSSDTRGVKLSLSSGQLAVTGDNPELGQVHEELAADYEGEDLAIGFNPKYLAELVAHITAERVVLDLSGELDPGVVRPDGDDGYLGVVMPMRI
ncbi:MAG TPA: DNA polymerase III subunit beta [Kofleriaceae bacterium]|nr:DNA polymerase III subunit beta [Kofleriaceae bacterium]